MERDTSFASVQNGQFIVNGKSYYFIGTNFWYGAILASKTSDGDRTRLKCELDSLLVLGIDNLRILVGADGPEHTPFKVQPTLQQAPGVYNEALLDGLDYLMCELGRRDMKAVLYLNNSWEWSGGYSQYLMWSGAGASPIPAFDGWEPFRTYVSGFIASATAKQLFLNHVREIVSRTNQYTGLPYAEDPAIFSWQIANEPRAFSEENKEAFAEWIGCVAREIRRLDPNHMISTGSEGRVGCENDLQLWRHIHAFPEISYTTIHIWPYNWHWVDETHQAELLPEAIKKTNAYIAEHAAVSAELQKPMVLEEFGFPRDNMSIKPGTAVVSRDTYYTEVFRILHKSVQEKGIFAGCNFWAWGGMAKPEHEFWLRGDDYCGDPAQEPQGLNSVFYGDTTTELIRSSVMDLK